MSAFEPGKLMSTSRERGPCGKMSPQALGCGGKRTAEQGSDYEGARAIPLSACEDCNTTEEGDAATVESSTAPALEFAP